MLEKLKEWFYKLFYSRHNWNYHVRQIVSAERKYLKYRDKIPQNQDKITVCLEFWETALINAKEYLDNTFKPHKNSQRRIYLEEQILKISEEYRKHSNTSKIESVKETTKKVNKQATQVAVQLLNIQLRNEFKVNDDLQKKADSFAKVAERFKIHRKKEEIQRSPFSYLLNCFCCFRPTRVSKKVYFADEQLPITETSKANLEPALKNGI